MSIASQSPEKRPIRILLANPRGYCAGVDRAIQMVEAALRLREEPIYVRHEIVHNRYVVEELEAKGAIFVDEVDQVPDGAVVIFSAHGVAKRVVDQAEGRKLEYLDATCPLVNKVHFEAQHHHRAGRHILFIGHKGHPEVEGTLGQVPEGAVTVIGSVAEAEAVDVPDADKIAYLTQTTLSVDDTAAIVDTLTRRFPAIKGPNKADICYATTNRQEAVRALARQSDLLLVMGAPNSSNSNRLVEVARANGCTRAMLIERASDIAWDALDGVETVGLTAGASAPELLVQEVIENFRLRFDVTLETLTVSEENVSFSIPKALVG